MTATTTRTIGLLFLFLAACSGSRAVAQSGCLAASDPPFDPPDSAAYVYDCHDSRETGAVPPVLGEFVAFHTRLPDADTARDPRNEASHPISGGYADVIVNLPGLGGWSSVGAPATCPPGSRISRSRIECRYPNSSPVPEMETPRVRTGSIATATPGS